MPVITLFWKDQIGMSLADIMILQALFGATVVVRVSSGYLAIASVGADPSSSAPAWRSSAGSPIRAREA
jgi:hypothetical protein